MANTDTIIAALDASAAALRRIMQRHQATGYNFSETFDKIIAARAAAQAMAGPSIEDMVTAAAQGFRDGRASDVDLIRKLVAALETCDPGDWTTGHVIGPSYDADAVSGAICEGQARLSLPRLAINPTTSR